MTEQSDFTQWHPVLSVIQGSQCISYIKINAENVSEQKSDRSSCDP